MGGLPNQGPRKFIIIWIYLVAFVIIISFHILLYLFTSFHISVHWQVDVPKTQILLGSKGSSGFVSFPASFHHDQIYQCLVFTCSVLGQGNFQFLNILTVCCIAAVQVWHNQHPFLLPLIAFIHDQMHQCLHMLNTWTRSLLLYRSGTINTLAQETVNQGLLGIMVWFCRFSVIPYY